MVGLSAAPQPLNLCPTMATKSISQLYLGAYASLATRQHARHGNPTADQMPAPTHVPQVIESAIQSKLLTVEQGRKLASAVGKLAYGEYGLTPGRVNPAIRKAMAGSLMPYHEVGMLESRLCGY